MLLPGLRAVAQGLRLGRRQCGLASAGEHSGCGWAKWITDRDGKASPFADARQGPDHSAAAAARCGPPLNPGAPR